MISLQQKIARMTFEEAQCFAQLSNTKKPDTQAAGFFLDVKRLVYFFALSSVFFWKEPITAMASIQAEPKNRTAAPTASP